MSKASRQSIALLAIVNGVFITIEDYNLEPELMPTILYGKYISKECIDSFPETGNKNKNFKWIMEKINEADKFLNETDSFYSAIVLVSLGFNIISDLMERIKDKKKLELLEPIQDALKGISDSIDPKGDKFEAYEEADSHLNEVYRILEF